MEYYWELRSKNAQNIKALMCPLYKNEKRPIHALWERGVNRFARADTQSIKQQEEEKWWPCGGVTMCISENEYIGTAEVVARSNLDGDIEHTQKKYRASIKSCTHFKMQLRSN